MNELTSVPAPTKADDTSRVRRDRRRHDLTGLLERRDDLRGVYGFADVTDEAMRWSA